MMNNSSTWMEMKRNDIDKLGKLQNSFLNTLLNTYHCPIPLMHLDLDILSIHLFILKEKLMLYHHVANLKENAVARRVQEVSQKFHFPGLKIEVSHFLSKHEIIDVNSFSKSEWKRFHN